MDLESLEVGVFYLHKKPMKPVRLINMCTLMYTYLHIYMYMIKKYKHAVPQTI